MSMLSTLRQIVLFLLCWPVLCAWAQGCADSPALRVPCVEELVGDIEPDALIRVRITGLDAWSASRQQSPWRLVPHVEGRPLAGIYPIGVSIREGWVQFHLRILPANQAAWDNLLSPPAFERSVSFSVGLEQDDEFASRYSRTNDTRARLIVIRRGWAAIAALMLLVNVLGFGYLAFRTPMLFERPAADAPGSRPRLSPAKVQFALWFFAVFTAFMLIWLTTGRLDSLNSSIVAALGISSGTALGEAFLGQGDRDTRTSAPVMPESPVRLRDLLSDLACDVHGASLHRFQILAWTLALLVAFISNVYYDLTMPVFGSELLYLLGLSSGYFVAQSSPATRRNDPPGAAQPGTRTRSTMPLAAALAARGAPDDPPPGNGTNAAPLATESPSTSAAHPPKGT